MTISELRNNIKNHLSGKFFKSIFMYVIFSILTVILIFSVLLLGSFVTVLVGSSKLLVVLSIVAMAIVTLLLTFILNYSITVSMLKLYRNEPVSSFSFLSKENLKGKFAIKLNLYFFWKLLLPYIAYIGGMILIIAGLTVRSSSSLPLLLIGALLILVGIVLVILKTFLYVLIIPVRHDNTQVTTKEVFEISASYMKGKRFKYFLLQLSYYAILFLIGIIAGIVMGFVGVPGETASLVSNIISLFGGIILFPFTSFALFTYYDYVSNRSEVTPVQE